MNSLDDAGLPHLMAAAHHRANIRCAIVTTGQQAAPLSVGEGRIGKSFRQPGKPGSSSGGPTISHQRSCPSITLAARKRPVAASSHHSEAGVPHQLASVASQSSLGWQPASCQRVQPGKGIRAQ